MTVRHRESREAVEPVVEKYKLWLVHNPRREDILHDTENIR